jgi:hypothetical protein
LPKRSKESIVLYNILNTGLKSRTITCIELHGVRRWKSFRLAICEWMLNVVCPLLSELLSSCGNCQYTTFAPSHVPIQTLTRLKYRVFERFQFQFVYTIRSLYFNIITRFHETYRHFAMCMCTRHSVCSPANFLTKSLPQPKMT